jgi:hypothetical protein
MSVGMSSSVGAVHHKTPDEQELVPTVLGFSMTANR